MAKAKPEYPETPEQWQVFRRKMLQSADTKAYRIKSNEQLTRNHPLVQLFLAGRSIPEHWRFWFEKGSIWTQERVGGTWVGPVFKLRWDGVIEIPRGG